MLGQLAATVSGTQAFEGFHTIDLLSLVPLTQGQDFYVELQTSNGQQANDGNILLQRLLDFQNVTGYAYTTALPGESFFSDNGVRWTDLQTVEQSANFAIDALTVAAADSAWKGGDSGGSSQMGGRCQLEAKHRLPSGPGLTITFGKQPAANNIVEIDSGGKTVGNLIFFAATSTTIRSPGGFSLTLDNNGRLSTIDVTGSHTIATSLILNNDAQVIGSGTVTLSGGISGPHDLDVLGNVVAGSLQVSTLAIESGASLKLANTIDTSYAGVIRGGGTLTKLGAGKFTLTAANIFTGLTTVAGGTLELGRMPRTACSTLAVPTYRPGALSSTMPAARIRRRRSAAC